MEKKAKMNILKDLFCPQIEVDVIEYVLEDKQNVEDAIECLLQMQNNNVSINNNSNELDINSPRKIYNHGMNPHLDSPVYVEDNKGNKINDVVIIKPEVNAKSKFSFENAKDGRKDEELEFPISNLNFANYQKSSQILAEENCSEKNKKSFGQKFKAFFKNIFQTNQKSC